MMDNESEEAAWRGHFFLGRGAHSHSGPTAGNLAGLGSSAKHWGTPHTTIRGQMRTPKYGAPTSVCAWVTEAGHPGHGDHAAR